MIFKKNNQTRQREDQTESFFCVRCCRKVAAEHRRVLAELSAANRQRMVDLDEKPDRDKTSKHPDLKIAVAKQIGYNNTHSRRRSARMVSVCSCCRCCEEFLL